jgi:hypothetical protein
MTPKERDAREELIGRAGLLGALAAALPPEVGFWVAFTILWAGKLLALLAGLGALSGIGVLVFAGKWTGDWVGMQIFIVLILGVVAAIAWPVFFAIAPPPVSARPR